MKKSPPLWMALLGVLISFSLNAQVAFWSDNFETGNSSSGLRTPENDGGTGGPPFNAYFCRTPATGTVNQNTPFTGFQGSNFWAGEDHNRSQLSWASVDNFNTREQRIDWTGINISGRTGLRFRGMFAANSTNTPFDNRTTCNGGPTSNNTDYVIVQRSIDGGPYVDVLRFFTKGNNGSNGYLYQETTGDSCGDGTQLTNSFANFTVNISGTGTTMSIRLLAYSEGNNEEWGVDNFQLFSDMTGTQSQVNLTCNGVCNGSATVVINDGTPPYLYSWAPSGGSAATASSLCAGTYTCTITDAVAATLTKTFTITQPPAIVATPVSFSNITCNGGNNGSAQISASGGTGTLTYNWTPGNPTGDGTTSVTGLTAGGWTCTVTDANSCTTTVNFSLTEPTAVVAAPVAQSNVSCNGNNDGSATVSASGGAGSYSFSWAPSGGSSASASNLAPGSYTCTVTDANGCTGTQIFTITEPAILTVSASSNPGTICSGDAVNLSASGAVTYNWMPGNLNGASVADSPLSTTTYTVTGTDGNGCTATDVTTVTVNATPALSVVSNPANGIVCSGDQATLTASGAQSYSWTGGITNGVPFAPVSTTTYTVTGTSVDGCTATATQAITVQNCTFTTRLNATWCGATNCNIGQVVVAFQVPGATNYEFWFQNASLNYSQTRVKGNGIANLPLSWVPGLQYGNTYQVRIRAYVNNTWQAYGPTCTISLAPTIPLTQLTNCAATGVTYSSVLTVGSVAGALNYEFEISNAQQPLTVTRSTGSTTPSINLSWFSGLQYGRTYDVRVRSNVGGVWSSFGPTCTITMMSTAPATQLTNCAATGLSHTSSLSYSAVVGATNYLINISNSALGYNVSRTTGNNATYISLNNWTGLLANTTYTVTVASYVGGAWSPAGPPCTITIGSVFRALDPSADAIGDEPFAFAMVMYPNPLTDGQNPTLVISGANEQLAIVHVMDLTGRVVTSYALHCEGSEFVAQLTEFPELVSGMYIMQVTVGDDVLSQRFIVE